MKKAFGVILFLILNFSCKKEIPLFIGQKYEGGIIAYIDNTGKHGFVVAPQDQSKGIPWCYIDYLTTNATGKAIGSGKANTELIVDVQDTINNYAAKLCYDLVIGGYSDWYLPSKDELNQIYINQEAIGNLERRVYWSSSEENNLEAWGQDLSGGIGSNSNNGICIGNKKDFLFVRAIRQF